MLCLLNCRLLQKKKRINKLVQYNVFLFSQSKTAYKTDIPLCAWLLFTRQQKRIFTCKFRCICEIDYNPTSRLKIRLKFDFPVKMKVVTSQCRIAPKIHDPLPFWPMGARTTSCRLYHGSIRIVMLKFLSKILYLHPLKIQKLLYDLIACKQLPTTVYVIESCMLTPGRGSIRCNITENRCKRVPGFGFVILIHHRQLMVKIFLFPN